MGRPVAAAALVMANIGLAQIPGAGPASADTIIRAFAEDFDGVTPPALPAGWTATRAVGSSGDELWHTDAFPQTSLPNVVSVDAHDHRTDMRLESPAFIPETGMDLTFQHRWALDHSGGVLEIKIGGGSYRDWLEAGGTFTGDGYTGLVAGWPSATDDNTRRAWTGIAGVLGFTVAKFPASAFGQSVQLRWRLLTTSDSQLQPDAWRIDSIEVDKVVPDPQADVRVTKTANAGAVTAGENITYTITVANLVPGSVAANVSLTDNIPANTTFVSRGQSSDWDCTDQAARWTCTRDSLTSTHGDQFFTFVVKVNAGTTSPINNTATVRADGDTAVAGNNVATAATSINGIADITVTKAGSPSRVLVGDNITYTITVANSVATSVASAVVLNDFIPFNTTFVSRGVLPSGWLCDPQAVGSTDRLICTRDTLTPADGNQVFTMVVKVNSASTATISNTANVTANGDTVGLGNNVSTVTTPVDLAGQSQSISYTSVAPFNPPVGSTYTPSAEATSGLPVTFSIAVTSTSVCSIGAANLVTFNATGTCAIQANQAGNGSYAPASQVTQLVNVIPAGPGSQTISFTSTAPINPPVGATYTPTATATSGLAVTFSIAGGSSSVCSIGAANLVTFTATGSCVIHADQAGNGSVNPAQRVSQTVTVVPAPQAPIITSADTTTFTVGQLRSFTVTSTGVPTPSLSLTGTLPAGVTFTANANGTATLAGTPVAGSQGTYELGIAAVNGVNPDDGQTFILVVNPAAPVSQTISFTSTAPSNPPVGATYTPAATASSGLPVTFSIASSSGSVCSIGAANLVTFSATGSCVIQADQTGNANFAAALRVTQTATVVPAAPASQTISFTSAAPSNPAVGATYTPTATATSGLPVSFSISGASSSVCSIGAANLVTFNATGSCVIQADQAGNATFAAASRVTQTVTVVKANQTIAFTSTAPANPAVGATYTATATATSGLPVSFSIASSSSAVCSIGAANLVTFNATGSCVIQADQAGNATFAAAARVTQTVTVVKVSQTVSFTSAAPSNPPIGATYTPTATATSGLPVTFSIASTSSSLCSIGAANLVTFNATGSCVIQADQAGNANIAAASRVTQTVTVVKVSQTVSFTSTAPISPSVGATYTPAATATSGLAVSFSIASGSSLVCSIGAANLVTFNATGSCVIQADHAGNVTFAAAARVTQTVTVAKANQTISFTSAPPVSPPVGATYTPTATATSGLTVTFSIAGTSSSVCSIGAANLVTFNAVGPCVIQADQAGNANVAAALRVTQTATVVKASQTINFAQPPSRTAGDAPFTVSATATSGLPVSFSVPSGGLCTISGATVTILGVGTCAVTANQAGNTNYNAAPAVTRNITIAKATPTISGLASAGGPIGASVHDVATVAGGASPTGTVTFRLFTNNTCATQLFTSTNNLVGASATSGSFSPATPGTYYWTASYNGDANNNSASSACTAPNQSVTITKASPLMSGQASAGGLLATPVRDVATLSGGSKPTGTVTFRLFSNNTCATEVFTSTNALSGLTATSNWFTPSVAGTYWWTALYNGDANNNTASSACQAPNQSVVIRPFQAPAYTRTITGDLLGPVTVNAGDSVLITAARVVGPVTVNPGGALTVVNSSITGGVVANAPGFFSMCGSEVSGPAPATALSVSNATAPIRVGDPATGCARNRFAGQVTLSGNLAVTFGANEVSHNATIDTNGPGNTIVKANTVFGTLGCAGNAPGPTNGGQPNTAGTKTGQCASL